MRFFTVILTLMFATSAMAVVNVKAGDTVPEDGVFLTKEEAARIIAETDALKIKHLEELEYEKEKANLKFDNYKQLSESILSSNTEKYEFLLESKETEIESLYKQLEGEQYEHWWFAAGSAVGVVASIVIFFAAVQVQQVDLVQ